ncbi:HAAS domain-containing protein [Halobacillus faecis]
MHLSKKSEKFLESLHLYLISSGKKETDTREIVEELRDHLTEAEKEGKNVDDMIGRSPKEFMEQVSKEMPFDFRMLISAFTVFVFGTLSYLLLGDIINGGAELSMIQMIGYPILMIVYLLSLTTLLRYTSLYQFDKKKEYMLIGIFGFLKISLFIAVLTLDQTINSPVIVLSPVGNVIAALLTISFFIGASLWARTWIMIVTVLIMIIPEVLVQILSFSEEASLITKSVLIFGGLFLYFWILNRREKSKESYATP